MLAARSTYPFGAGVEAGGRLRLPVGWSAGVKSAADPVKRIMVNVGSALCAPGCGGGPARHDVCWCAQGVAESA
jgi:hypothetical protein